MKPNPVGKFIAGSLCAASLLSLTASAQAQAPAQPQNVLTVHRLSAALAVEAVSEAVSSCAKQGYKVTAAVIDSDGVDQAVLRGDGAMMTTLDAARDKAYTALMLGAARGEESSGAVATRMSANAPAGGLVKLPHVLMAQGALVIRAGGEPVAAIGVGGAPGGGLDEACARAGLDKISDRLK